MHNMAKKFSLSIPCTSQTYLEDNLNGDLMSFYEEAETWTQEFNSSAEKRQAMLDGEIYFHDLSQQEFEICLSTTTETICGCVGAVKIYTAYIEGGDKVQLAAETDTKLQEALSLPRGYYETVRSSLVVPSRFDDRLCF